MIFSEFTLGEQGFSDLNIIKREFWFSISPTKNESWADINEAVKDKSITSLRSSDVAYSFSEFAFSQTAISDLGLLVTREGWQVILNTDNIESWSNLSPTGSESWTNIAPSGTETWKNIL